MPAMWVPRALSTPFASYQRLSDSWPMRPATTTNDAIVGIRSGERSVPRCACRPEILPGSRTRDSGHPPPDAWNPRVRQRATRDGAWRGPSRLLERGTIAAWLPSSVALAIAFLASVVLTEFALLHDEEQLRAIGFGGAALAAVLTTENCGNGIAVEIYGLTVETRCEAGLPDPHVRGAGRLERGR